MELAAGRAVAEVGGVERAAAELGIAASALSRQVTLLEAALGSQLFLRGRQLQLTAAGVQLLPLVRDAMRAVDDVVAAAPNLSHRSVAVVAEDDSLLCLVSPPSSAGLRLSRVAVTEHSTALLTGQADLVVSFHPVTTSGTHCERIGEEPLVAFAPSDATSRRSGSHRPKLSGEEAVLLRDSPRERLSEIPRLGECVVVDSYALALAYARRKHGWTVAPRYLTEAATEAGLASVSGLSLGAASIYVIQRAPVRGSADPVLRQLTESIQEKLGGQLSRRRPVGKTRRGEKA